jgi:hypothetical protein
MQFTTQRPVRVPVCGGSDSIRQCLLDEITKGIRVIDGLDEISYRRRSDRSASVGEQFRHNLDFVNTFLSGIAIGRIDYSKRERDIRVERSREWAVERFEVAGRKLTMLSRAQIGSIVSVRSETDAGVWLPSSVAREMEFVLSHTIHHHALIAEKLVGQGIILDTAFGVAPSTKSYWDKLAA